MLWWVQIANGRVGAPSNVVRQEGTFEHPTTYLVTLRESRATNQPIRLSKKFQGLRDWLTLGLAAQVS